jgi:hypothetical protein
MKNDSKTETEEYYTEVRKLEVRLDEYLEEEEIFIQKLRNSIMQLKALHTTIDQPLPKNAEVTQEISKLKADALSSLSEAMKLEGKAEHEKSHLLESYGALIVALQKLK